jgi:hypothetical protein
MNYLRRRWRFHQPRLVLGTDFGAVGSAEQWGARIMRGRALVESVHHGPNIWSALVIHPDGSYDPIAFGHNLLTTVGRDLIAAAYGNPAGKDGALTASSATSATPAGGGMTVDAYKGWRVYCPEAAITTAPAYGNVGSNSATVLTIDQWWTAADGVASTPAATNGYHIQPSAEARFMGVSAEGTAPAAGDTVLATEQTANGLGRALATYAHTGGTATYTLQKSFAVTGSVTVHKGGLFTAANTTAAGVLVFEALLNSDAIVNNGDTLVVTATVTLS